MKQLVEVFKSPRKDEMYLYVDRLEQFKRVPEALLEQFGTPKSVMVIPLTADRKLARVEATDVLDGIRDQGFYLQMPPPKSDEMDELGSKLAEYCARFDQDPE